MEGQKPSSQDHVSERRRGGRRGEDSVLRRRDRETASLHGDRGRVSEARLAFAVRGASAHRTPRTCRPRFGSEPRRSRR